MGPWFDLRPNFWPTAGENLFTWVHSFSPSKGIICTPSTKWSGHRRHLHWRFDRSSSRHWFCSNSHWFSHCFGLQTLAKPLNLDDPIPRSHIISQKKLVAEGQLEECKTILGWSINTRTLSISLPLDKHKKWSIQLIEILSAKRVSSKQLEILVGRLNHMGSILPMMRHFLNRLRSALLRSLKSGWTCLSIHEKGDLHLLQSLLEKSTRGISINNVVFRKPTHIYRSDASEFGLGGYNLISGRAWRFEIPPDCRLRTSINSLGFLACIITVWIDFIHNEIPEESCILSKTDNSSAAAWLHKSNFADDANYAIQLTTARHTAQLVIDNNCCIWIELLWILMPFRL